MSVPSLIDLRTSDSSKHVFALKVEIMTTSYATVSEALADMKRRGFTIDFNVELKGNWNPHNLLIVEVHRFEGQTSSDDEAVIYGIETAKGNKGVLVNGYGISSEPVPDDFIRKIRIRH
jgi:hypothetical protein